MDNGCKNPNCSCHLLRRDSAYPDVNLNVDMRDMGTFFPEWSRRRYPDLTGRSAPKTKAELIADAIKQLDNKSDFAQLELAVSGAKAKAEKDKAAAEAKAKLDLVLQGVAEVKKPSVKSRRFLLVVCCEGDISTHEGIAYSDGAVEVAGGTDGDDLPSYSENRMELLLRSLEREGCATHVAYLD